MKKLIAMAIAILLTGCIAAFASGTNYPAKSSKQFDYQISFCRIVVEDDIDLELKESNSKSIEVTGNAADIGKVDWKIKDHVLYLKSKKGSLKDKVKVNLDVTGLKEIFIKGQSVVSSSGPLLSPSLYVYMDSDSYVSIKNFGHIYVVNGVDTEIEVKTIIGEVKVGR